MEPEQTDTRASLVSLLLKPANIGTIAAGALIGGFALDMALHIGIPSYCLAWAGTQYFVLRRIALKAKSPE